MFALLLLDNRNRLIEFKELFQGTVDATSVYCNTTRRHAEIDD